MGPDRTKLFPTPLLIPSSPNQSVSLQPLLPPFPSLFNLCYMQEKEQGSEGRATHTHTHNDSLGLSLPSPSLPFFPYHIIPIAPLKGTTSLHYASSGTFNQNTYRSLCHFSFSVFCLEFLSVTLWNDIFFFSLSLSMYVCVCV